ncbi:MAG TPA: hypothetical protein VJQ82_26530 [Terriglobales bacterium]|nr:hypothetical protein [Terriglobales bacterium]
MILSTKAEFLKADSEDLRHHPRCLWLDDTTLGLGSHFRLSAVAPHQWWNFLLGEQTGCAR